MLTGEQVKAARALARLEQAELAELAGVSWPTIKRMEAARGYITGSTRIEQAVREAFARRGIEFIEAGDGKGEGVRRVAAPAQSGS